MPSASPGIDVVVVREPTEGLYRGIEFDVGSEAARQLRTWLARRGEAVEPDSGISLSPLSRRAAQRVFDFAFRYATANGRGRVTAAHKATVMRSTDGLFLATAETVAANHPAVAFDEMLIDRLALELVRNPQRFDVLVMQNLYGDIFSDLAAGLTGGLGYAAGANYGDQVAVFETAHGVVNHRSRSGHRQSPGSRAQRRAAAPPYRRTGRRRRGRTRGRRGCCGRAGDQHEGGRQRAHRASGREPLSSVSRIGTHTRVAPARSATW